VLGVGSDIPLIDAIRYCWASLFSDRVVGYFGQHPSLSGDAALAVLCQELVAATVGGVIFTRDPVVNRGTAIEASWGIPSPLVSGDITPDRCDLAPDGSILRRRVGSKRVICEYSSTRLQTRPATAAEREAFCLSDPQIQELGDMGRQIEGLFHAPQDIEWAYLSDKLYILQSRPITGIPSPARTQREVRQ